MTNNKQQTLPPKEKAKELVSKMEKDFQYFASRQIAIQHALIAVEEILSINSVDKDEDLSNYWEEVKKEIETYGGGEQ
jgi:predicted DNA-binding ArsR family transcriptional regulator